MINDLAIDALLAGLSAKPPRRGRLVSEDRFWREPIGPDEEELATAPGGLYLSWEQTTEAAFDNDAGWFTATVETKDSLEDAVLESRFFSSDQSLFQRRWSQPSAAEVRSMSHMSQRLGGPVMPPEEPAFDERWVVKMFQQEDALGAGLLVRDRFKRGALRALALHPDTSWRRVAGENAVLEISGPLKLWQASFPMDRVPFAGSVNFQARLEFHPGGKWLNAIELRVEHEDQRAVILSRYYGDVAQNLDCPRPSAPQCYPTLAPIETNIEAVEVTEVTQTLQVQIEGQDAELLLEWRKNVSEKWRDHPAAPTYLAPGDEIYVAGFWTELLSGLKFITLSVRRGGKILDQYHFVDEELDAEGLPELADVRVKTSVLSADCLRQMRYTLRDTFGRRWHYEGGERPGILVVGAKVIIRPTWIDGRISLRDLTDLKDQPYWLDLVDQP
jgi:hypothetical protein